MTPVIRSRSTNRGPQARGYFSAVALAVTPLVVIGFARFAFGLVLPEMRSDLGWSYTTAGLVTTVNALGYLGGALGAESVARRIGIRAACLA